MTFLDNVESLMVPGAANQVTDWRIKQNGENRSLKKPKATAIKDVKGLSVILPHILSYTNAFKLWYNLKR